MRRLGFVLVPLALAALAPAAAAAPRAKARLLACEPSARTAVFEGDMRAAVPPAIRMQMRFRLKAQMPGSRRFRKVAAPGFGVWNTAVPGVGRYVYTKTVEELVGPARYRAVVHFRWSDPAGRVLQEVRRATAVCAQPDLRPDLRVVAVTPGADPGTWTVTVRNDGRSATGPFRVEFQGAAASTLSVRVEDLRPRESAALDFAGSCEDVTEVAATADVEDEVDERDETDNRLAVPCPPGP